MFFIKNYWAWEYDSIPLCKYSICIRVPNIYVLRFILVPLIIIRHLRFISPSYVLTLMLPRWAFPHLATSYLN